MYVWFFFVERCMEYKQFCYKFCYKRMFLLYFLVFVDIVGIGIDMLYGFFVDMDNCQWIIFDCFS